MNRELFRLIFAQVCLHAAMTGMRLAGPLLALQLGYSAAAVGVLLALFALTQVFLALPAGRFADRHGLKKPLALAVISATVGAGLAAAMPVFPVLCVAALMTGGATGVAVISLQRHAGRAAEGATQLKQVFSWLAVAPAAANFVGPFAAGLMIDHAGQSAGDLPGYRWAFVLLAVLPVVSWLLTRRVRELPLSPRIEGAQPRAWDLLRAPMFKRLLFINWMQAASWDVHTFVLPLLGHELGLSASVIGSILGAFALAAAGVRLALPLLASRASERHVIMIANVTTALVFAVYPFMTSAIGMGICSVMLGLALGAVQPMIMSMLHQITDHARHGEALGLRLMTINASSVAMPMLFGAAGALIGVAGLFWVFGGIVGTGTLAVRGMRMPGASAHGH
ncbi:MAG: MFS transporter [Pseudomonadota bacterium]